MTTPFYIRILIYLSIIVVNFFLFTAMGWSGGAWIIVSSILVVLVKIGFNASTEQEEEYDPWDELSVRIRNALSNVGCEPTPQGVAAYSMEQLLQVPGLGKKSIAELQEWLSRHSMKPEEEKPESKQEHTCTCEGLTLTQALEMFDLREDATDKEIHTAYMRLMKKVHPDTGGSTFLAKQVNEAQMILSNR